MKLFLAVLLLFSSLTQTLGAEDTGLPRPASDLAFMIPGAGPKTLSQYKGKVVALEFILTTCVHCQAASKVMSRLQSELGSRGFQALDLAINVLEERHNTEAADALVQKFKNDYQVGFPVGYVSHDEMPGFMGFSIMSRTVVPQLVLLDRQGIIRYQTPPSGDATSMEESTIRQRVLELLALPAPTISSKSKPARPKKHT